MFFIKREELSAYDLLKRAIKMNHADSSYTYNMLRLISTDESIRIAGVKDFTGTLNNINNDPLLGIRIAGSRIAMRRRVSSVKSLMWKRLKEKPYYTFRHGGPVSKTYTMDELVIDFNLDDVFKGIVFTLPRVA